MEVLIIGVGGIGSIYSLLLRIACPSIRISFVARSNYDALKDSGVNIKSAKYGNHHLVPDAVYKTPEEASRSGVTFDYVFCTTKSLPESPATPLLEPAVSAKTIIVLIQNGLGIEEPIHAAFPENTLISCAAYIGVWQTGPGSVSHSALDRLELGTYPDASSVSEARHTRDIASLDKLVDLFKTGGCDTKIVGSMPFARWQKLVWNASFNCVCTITGLDTFAVIQCPQAKTMVLSAMTEIIEAANAAGHALSHDLIQANWDNTAKMGVAYKPSMMLDYEAEREMEVDVILGSPIRQAEAMGIRVPTLSVMKMTLDILNWKRLHQKPISK